MKFPELFNCAKRSMPGPTLFSEPPFASAAEKTPAMAEPDVSGEPLSATFPLYSELSRSFQVFGGVLMMLLL